jgi:hypothetical protein
MRESIYSIASISTDSLSSFHSTHFKRPCQELICDEPFPEEIEVLKIVLGSPSVYSGNRICFDWRVLRPDKTAPKLIQGYLFVPAYHVQVNTPLPYYGVTLDAMARLFHSDTTGGEGTSSYLYPEWIIARLLGPGVPHESDERKLWDAMRKAMRRQADALTQEASQLAEVRHNRKSSRVFMHCLLTLLVFDTLLHIRPVIAVNHQDTLILPCEVPPI